jgi:hypothetical protein
MAQNKKLSDRQLKTIPVILSSRSLTEAGRKANVSRTQLNRWMAQDAFVEELERTRDQMLEGSLDALQAGAKEAVDSLLRLIRDPAKGIRLKASDRSLFYILKVKELRDIEARLTTLEKLILAEKGSEVL